MGPFEHLHLIIGREGVGKSTLCRFLSSLGDGRGGPAEHVDVDSLEDWEVDNGTDLGKQLERHYKNKHIVPFGLRLSLVRAALMRMPEGRPVYLENSSNFLTTRERIHQFERQIGGFNWVLDMVDDHADNNIVVPDAPKLESVQLAPTVKDYFRSTTEMRQIKTIPGCGKIVLDLPSLMNLAGAGK